MEALAELALAIISFIIEVTVYAVVLLWDVALAPFSSRHRSKLIDRWRTSTASKVGLIVGTFAAISSLVIACHFFWIPLIVDKGEPVSRIESQSLKEQAKTKAFEAISSFLEERNGKEKSGEQE